MRYNDLPSDAEREPVWVWTSGKDDAKPARSPVGRLSTQMAPVQRSMKEGSQNVGGSHPPDRDFFVATKQEAKHVCFAPTTKPASAFILGCLSPPLIIITF